MTVSPNPANQNINVKITKTKDTATSINEFKGSAIQNNNSTGITRISLYDFNTAILIKQWTYKEVDTQNYNLNIAGVKSGVYVLKMERDNRTTITKIIVR